MAHLIQIRRDTATNWNSVNPILAQGEFGWDMTSGLLKIGNGVTPWNTLSYYDSSGSSSASGSSAGIVTYSADPVTRADGSPLQEGDIYYNTGDNGLYTYDGAGWVAVGGASSSTVGTADSIRTYSVDPVTDAAGNPIAIGDMYYNTTDGVVYVYNGADFVPVAQDSTSVVSYAADPTGTPAAGDIYYNTTENVLKVFDGTTWTDASGGGAGGSVPTSPTEPVGPSNAGDVYYNTTTNEQYVYDGTSWTPVDSGVADSLRALPTAPTTDAQGNALAAGDVYYNTTDKVTYVYDGFAFNPQEGTASGYKTSPVAPAGAVEGDTYYNTTTNEVMVYDGSAWVPVGADTNTTVTNLSFNNTTGSLTLVDSDGATKATSLDGRYPTVAQVNTQISNTIQASVDFGDLNDVSVAAATSGQSVVYNGSAWVPATPFSGDYNDLINAPGGINSIDELGDVDTTTTPPVAGQILKWNGSNWVPGNDATSGGGGLNADTLDGFDSIYFLDYNNLINTPPGSTDTVITTTNFNTSTGVLTVTDSAGAVFTSNFDGRYLLSGSLATVASTGDYNDLLNVPTIATDISQLTDTTNLLVGNISDLGDVNTIGATSGHVLQFNGTTWVSAAPVAGPTTLENLSDTIITTPLAGQYLSWNGVAWVNSNVVHPAETVTSISIAGNIISYTDEAGTVTPITITHPAETVTTLGIAADVLTYTDEAGVATNITIPALGDPRYMGVSNGAPATRADGSAIQYADMYFESSTEKLMWNEGSSWLPVDSTTTNSSAVFDIATGDLTITDTRAGTVVSNLDGRYTTQADVTNIIQSSTSIADLSDVITTGAVIGSTLEFNGTNWVVGTDDVGTVINFINDLSDVNAVPSNTDVLSWNAGTAKWEATSLSTISNPLALDDLTDVTTTAPAQDDVVLWDATSSSWINSDIVTTVQSQLATEGTVRAIADSALDARVTVLEAIPAPVETVTTLVDNGDNTITYTDEAGTPTVIDLSLYLDDTNLARITSATLDGTSGIATFTRDDATTFTLDLSNLLDSPITSSVAGIKLDYNVVQGTNPVQTHTSVTTRSDGTALQDGDFLLFKKDDGAIPSNYVPTLYYWNSVTGAWVDTGANTDRLANLTDTAISSPSLGQVLQYNGTSWVNGTLPTNISTLAGLSDTNVAAVTDGQYLTWNATGSYWEPGSISGTVPDSQYAHTVLKPNGSGGWVEGQSITSRMHYSTSDAGFDVVISQMNVTAPFDTWPGTHYFNTSNDVIKVRDGNFDWNNVPSYPDAATIADGDVLTWVATENQGRGGWTPQAIASGASALTNLTDVTVTTASENDILLHNGTEFVNGPFRAPGAFPLPTGVLGQLVTDLDSESLWFKNFSGWTKINITNIQELSNVNPSSLQDGDVLTYDFANAQWVNAAPAGSSIPDGNVPGDQLYWDGTNWFPSASANLSWTSSANETVAEAYFAAQLGFADWVSLEATMLPNTANLHFYDQTDKQLKVYDKGVSAWVPVGGSGSIPDGAAGGNQLYWDGAVWFPGPNANLSWTSAADEATAEAFFVQQYGYADWTAMVAGLFPNSAHLHFYDTTAKQLKVYDKGVSAWVPVGGGGDSLYTADGTLTGTRTVDGDGNGLAFTNMGSFQASGNIVVTNATVNNVVSAGNAVALVGTQQVALNPGASGEVKVMHGGSSASGYLLPKTQPTAAGQVMGYNGVDDGGDNQLEWITPGGGGATIPNGTQFGSTLYWNGSSWVEETDVTVNPSLGHVYARNFMHNVENKAAPTIDFAIAYNKDTTSVSSGNVAFSVVNTPGAAVVGSTTLELHVSNGASITWPAAIQWPEGTPPTINDGKHIFSFITTDGGLTIFGNALTNYA